jgi:hypothetical protein
MNANNMNTKFNYAAIRANQPQPSANIRQAVQWVIDLDGTYAACEPSLLPPGTTGSTQFDHCIVALNIKNAAKAHIAEAEKLDRSPNPNALIVAGLSEVLIWKYAQIVLRQSGFDIRRGRIVGLLEDRSDEETSEVVQEPTVEVAPTVQSAYIQ